LQGKSGGISQKWEDLEYRSARHAISRIPDRVPIQLRSDGESVSTSIMADST